MYVYVDIANHFSICGTCYYFVYFSYSVTFCYCTVVLDQKCIVGGNYHSL